MRYASMRRFPILILTAVLAVAAGQAAFAVDPTALAKRLEAAMGDEAFAAARVLHFTWGVERDGQTISAYEHTWDRRSGDYRVSGVDRESGKPWLALFNVQSKEGRAWLGGEEIAGDALAGHLERAYGRFINDTYWLLMPWKWRDPGVNLTYIGTAEVDGATCDEVELSFGEVGLTSNDRYRAFLDRESGRMVRWSYVLQGEDGTPGAGEPTVWDWTGWVRVEPGAWFAERRVRLGGEGPPVAITTTGIELHVAPDAEQLADWFTAP